MGSKKRKDRPAEMVDTAEDRTLLEALVTREEWAALRGVSERSARRWGAAGQIPGAVVVDGRVMFPRNTTRVRPDRPAGPGRIEPLSLARESATAELVVMHGGDDSRTPRQRLLGMPGLLTVDQVADVLEIDVEAVLTHQTLLGVWHLGDDVPRFPQARIWELFGGRRD